MNNSSFVLPYLPASGRIAEIVPTPTSQRLAENLAASSSAVEFLVPSSEVAFSLNNVAPASAIRVVSPFALHQEEKEKYDLLLHQNWLHRFSLPAIRTLLAHQVASAKRVLFTVPSAYFPAERSTPGERLLTVEQWEEVLAPFEVEEIRTLDEEPDGVWWRILCVLRGQEVDEDLRSLLTLPEDPFPFGISAIVHTRNEVHQIKSCLLTLQGWTDEILVCDMESEDETVAVAEQLTERILTYPHIPNFDSARNASALFTHYRATHFHGGQHTAYAE